VREDCAACDEEGEVGSAPCSRRLTARALGVQQAGPPPLLPGTFSRLLPAVHLPRRQILLTRRLQAILIVDGCRIGWEEGGGHKPVCFVYAAIGKNFRSKVWFMPAGARMGGRKKGKEQFTGSHFVPFMASLMQQLKTLKTRSGRQCRVWIVMDTASQHTSTSTVTALDALHVPLLAGFPAYSPDINPIELVWSHLVEAMHTRRPRTLAGLQVAIKEEWGKLDQGVINRTIAGVPARMREIERMGGEWLKPMKRRFV